MSKLGALHKRVTISPQSDKVDTEVEQKRNGSHLVGATLHKRWIPKVGPKVSSCRIGANVRTLQLLTLALCLLLASGHVDILQSCDSSVPLGMINGEIQDWQITVSSTYPTEWDKGCHERHGRVYQPNGLGWCAKFKSSSEWLQVDLGILSKVTGVMTQGRGDGVEWVTSFMVSYSTDGFHWNYVSDQYGNQRVFEGNADSYSVKHSYLNDPVAARFVKFHTVHWNRHPSMRVEVIGCQVCKGQIALPPYGKLSASSEKASEDGSSCKVDDGYLVTNKGWCSKTNNANQWFQIDVGPPTLVTGVVTKGRGDTSRHHWVTKFSLSYSNDSQIWISYKDPNELNQKEFRGNFDKDLERYHYLATPFVARYIRFHPIGWQKRISMRAGILGCHFKGACSPGFMRINSDTPCVENMSFKKESWINNKRHYKRHIRNSWTHAYAARAVDGDTDPDLHSCTVLDNLHVEKPIWMVDLGVDRKIAGIIVVTWQGKGQDSKTTYKDYTYNLEKLSIYVDSKGGKEQIDQPGNLCGFITRLNDALFKPRLHVQCMKPMVGRYVYVEAQGVISRWQGQFSAVLCEVMVYD